MNGTVASCFLLALAALPIARAGDGDPEAQAANAAAQKLNAAARAANAAARMVNQPAARMVNQPAAAGRVPAVAASVASVQRPAAAPAQPQARCKGTIYLTFDSGSQSQAELIADVLSRHRIKATFFLANEKTAFGDYALDPSWSTYWKARVAEGHAIGSRTFDHVYLVKDAADGQVEVRPQYGEQAGKTMNWTPRQLCEDIQRVDQRFLQLTGAHIDPIWRAPAGRTSPHALAAGRACGYAYAGWSKAGFSGDELSSTTYPNAALLQKSLRELRDGDIFMAHMGIWSRQDPWAPANLEPLIQGLERQGFCFATLREHPDFAAAFKRR